MVYRNLDVLTKPGHSLKMRRGTLEKNCPLENTGESQRMTGKQEIVHTRATRILLSVRKSTSQKEKKKVVKKSALPSSFYFRTERFPYIPSSIFCKRLSIMISGSACGNSFLRNVESTDTYLYP